MKIKQFCKTAVLLAAVCSIQTTALAVDAPATATATTPPTSTTTSQSATAKTNDSATTTKKASSELLPSDVVTDTENKQIKKIYDVDKTVSPDTIPQEDFERGGLKYTFQDLLRIELPEIDHKTHTEKVTLSSSSNNAQEVLKLLPKSKSISTADGYTGTAYLDIASISTKVAGTESVSNDLTATREYPDMSEMDMENIPKQINDGGHTLTFSDVEWKSNAEEVNNFGDEETTYTAVVTYTGTETTTHTTGYSITATYAGDVTRRTDNKVRYIAVYDGAPIEEIVEIPEEETKDQTPPDMTGLVDDKQQDEARKNCPLPVSWILCGVFALLALLFAIRPPMCRRMLHNMQVTILDARDKAKEGFQKFNTETERIINERNEQQAAEDAAERERQEVFGPIGKLKSAMRSRRNRTPEAESFDVQDDDEDGSR